MKSTIALTPSKRLVIQPCKTGGIVLETVHGLAGQAKTIEEFHISEPQIGALLWAIEAAWPMCEASREFAPIAEFEQQEA